MWYTIKMKLKKKERKTKKRNEKNFAHSFRRRRWLSAILKLIHIHIYFLLKYFFSVSYSIQFLYLITWISWVLISVYWPNVQLVFFLHMSIFDFSIHNNDIKFVNRRAFIVVNKCVKCNLISIHFIWLFSRWAVNNVIRGTNTEYQNNCWWCGYLVHGMQS